MVKWPPSDGEMAPFRSRNLLSFKAESGRYVFFLYE